MALLASSALFHSVPGVVHSCSLTTLFYNATFRPLIVSHRLIQGPTSSIFVGPQRQEFVVHKALLCHLSPYFRGALNSNFIEAQNNAVELKDEDPECFQYIAAWMYRGKFGQFKYDSGSSREEALTLCTHMCRLYYLADFLRIEGLLLQILSHLLDLFDHFQDKKIVPLNSDVIAQVYENTSETSELRETIMNELVRVWCDQSLEVDIKDFEMCINHVQGVATALLAGLRSWREEHYGTTQEHLRASFSPTSSTTLNRLGPNIAHQVLNPVADAPVTRPFTALPPAHPAAVALASGPSPLATCPGVISLAPAPAVTTAPLNRRPFPPAAITGIARVCGRCGVGVNNTVPSAGQAGSGDRCYACRSTGNTVRRPRR